MVLPRMRGVVTACGVAAMLLAAPAENKAYGFFDCLFGWCGGCRTTYRAPYATTAYAPVCNPCATQTCRYVPQTCYRTVCQRVPVTTCLPVTRCDPCTGCPVTTYRPVTTWTTQTRLVPYTTYRVVYSPAVCNPCATSFPSVTYSPSSVGTVAAGSSCCTPSLSAPAITTEVPFSSPDAPATTPQTFQKSQSPATDGQAEPVPDANSDRPSAGPLFSPTRDRTTSLPVRQVVHYELILSPSKPAPIPRVPVQDARIQRVSIERAPVPTTRILDGGWRASRD